MSAESCRCCTDLLVPFACLPYAHMLDEGFKLEPAKAKDVSFVQSSRADPLVSLVVARWEGHA